MLATLIELGVVVLNVLLHVRRVGRVSAASKEPSITKQLGMHCMFCTCITHCYNRPIRRRDLSPGNDGSQLRRVGLLFGIRVADLTSTVMLASRDLRT